MKRLRKTLRLALRCAKSNDARVCDHCDGCDFLKWNPSRASPPVSIFDALPFFPAQANPTFAKGFSHLGLCNYRNAKFDESVSAYKRAAELDPARKAEYERGIALSEQAKRSKLGKATTSQPRLAVLLAKAILGSVMVFNAACVLLGFTAKSEWLQAKNRVFVVAFFSNALLTLASTHGVPKLKQEYWMQLVVDKTATRLMGGLCMLLGANFLLLIALSLPEVANLACAIVALLQRVSASAAAAATALFTGRLLDRTGSPFWRVAQWSAHVEVMALCLMVFQLATPRRNIMQVVVYAQSFQMRVMIEKATGQTSGVLQVAFSELDRLLSGLAAKAPSFVGGAYGKARGLISRQVALPDASAPPASRKCSIS